MSNIHLYADTVLENVTFILTDILTCHGRITKKFLREEQRRFQGNYAEDAINIALACLEYPLVFSGRCTEQQFKHLTTKAKERNALLIDRILRLKQGDEP